MVPWNDFITSFQKEIPLDTETERQLRYILGKQQIKFHFSDSADNSNTSFLSLYKFADFLQGFGPFRSCIENIVDLAREAFEQMTGFLDITATVIIIPKGLCFYTELWS